jgi:hypothetical protein
MELGALQWDMEASQITASAYLGVSVRPSLSAVRPKKKILDLTLQNVGRIRSSFWGRIL